MARLVARLFIILYWSDSALSDSALLPKSNRENAVALPGLVCNLVFTLPLACGRFILYKHS